MIGDGVELEPARHLAGELGVLDRVRFLGPVVNGAEVLAQLDLFMLPSEYESFGLAALEAMACGVPVVCSGAGGIPEVVEDQLSGILCTVGDYRCLAEAATNVLSDTEKHERMRRNARDQAVERFPQNRVVELYEQIYTRLMQE
jgi:glycosyltransferase involved in cell wall biosynthesis